MSTLLRYILNPSLPAITVALLVACGCGREVKKQPVTAETARRPNIILVYTDDLDCETLFGQWPGQSSEQIQFPTLRELAESGTLFTNFHVTTPVCGPSRACLYTGQYAHRNNYRVNNPDVDQSSGFSGGYQQFDPSEELGGWMRAAGYETAQVGKYLHEGFRPDESRRETWTSMKVPGWDYFIVSMGSRYFSYYRTNGREPDLTQIADRYRTDVEVETIRQIISGRKGDDSGKPLFLCWTPLAPHTASREAGMVANRHREMFADALPPDLQRRLAQQRPGVATETAKIPAADQQQLRRAINLHRDRLRSLQALDEGLAKIRETLQQSGQLDNTLFVFTSDHGFSLGDFGHFGKRLPYDRITRVPFIVSGPGVPAGATCDQLLGNIDIAPTLLELAGGDIPDTVDGRSFAKLIYAPRDSLEPPREAILIENWSAIRCPGGKVQATYTSLRTADHIYTEWATGDMEYYDVVADPEQLNNLYPSLSADRKDELTRQLRRLRQTPMNPRFANLFQLHPHVVDNVVSAAFEPEPFHGYVEDERGVKSVQLELYCEETNRYWDGTDWTAEPTRVNAKLDLPGGIITRWSWDLDTSQIAFREGRLRRRDTVVHVIATDVDGNQTRWNNAQTLRIEVDNPETWIDDPPGLFVPHAPFTISGRAADNRKLARLEITVRDLDRDLYWDGNEWTSERRRFDLEMSSDPDAAGPGDHCRWTYTFDGPREGRVFIGVRAWDNDRNFDMSIPSRTIMPDAGGDAAGDQRKLPELDKRN